MIPIYRPLLPPRVLTNSAIAQTGLDCLAYESDPQAYLTGSQRLSIKQYYSHPTVKSALRRIHKDKCCYCESKYGTSAYLHVEHFRPKGEVRQSFSDPKEYPGYYWLAYSWTNLLLACFDCNTLYKNSLFPLKNPTRRARSHNDDVNREQRLLVDPTDDNPRSHIRFVADIPVAETEMGTHTIEGLGLRRPNLVEARLEWYRKIDLLGRIITCQPHPAIQGIQQEARDQLKGAMQPASQFSAMVIDYVIRNKIPVTTP